MIYYTKTSKLKEIAREKTHHDIALFEVISAEYEDVEYVKEMFGADHSCYIIAIAVKYNGNNVSWYQGIYLDCYTEKNALREFYRTL